ncbi:MAG TPA: hypothetical protein VFQ87_03240 [Bradyrhizobium sp.]|jgi:hypothetical protein|nr:hypothetical protein [Bradyrhizobium sp.]
MKITVTIEHQQVAYLLALARSSAVPKKEETDREGIARVLRHLVMSAADGVRRPGSWERGWVVQAFGEIGE